MNAVVCACCIIHNVVCHDRRDKYTGTTNVQVHLEQPSPFDTTLIETDTCTYDKSDIWRIHTDPIEDPDQQFQLQRSLIEHICRCVSADISHGRYLETHMKRKTREIYCPTVHVLALSSSPLSPARALALASGRQGNLA